MAPVIEFDRLSKRYRSLTSKDRWALDDFTLAVQPGELVGFLGPNGAGKTTAIHIALGLLRPTSGRGQLLGRAFGDVAVRRRIGFLSENPAFYHQSARKVLEFCGALNGVRGTELSRRIDELLDSVGLLEEADRNIGKFSRGMLQRVGVAQALINDPDLLILDEPTSALDPLSRLKVRALLIEVRNRGKSVFLSSHQLSEVELICDHVVFVRSGRIVASGKTHELLRSSDQLEITASGVKVAPPQAHSVHDENGCLSFTVEAAAQREVIEQIWMNGGTIRSLTPKTRSLEEIFVELMQAPERGDEVHP